jgi:hypothetical protein
MNGIRMEEARGHPLPGFFVSVASKGLSRSTSLLESRVFISVDFKRVRSLRNRSSGEGQEDAAATSGGQWTGYR